MTHRRRPRWVFLRGSTARAPHLRKPPRQSRAGVAAEDRCLRPLAARFQRSPDRTDPPRPGNRPIAARGDSGSRRPAPQSRPRPSGPQGFPKSHLRLRSTVARTGPARAREESGTRCPRWQSVRRAVTLPIEVQQARPRGGPHPTGARPASGSSGTGTTALPAAIGRASVPGRRPGSWRASNRARIAREAGNDRGRPAPPGALLQCVIPATLQSLRPDVSSSRHRRAAHGHLPATVPARPAPDAHRPPGLAARAIHTRASAFLRDTRPCTPPAGSCRSSSWASRPAPEGRWLPGRCRAPRRSPV